MELMNYFLEFENHLINDDKPSLYFNKLVETDLYPKEYPFNMITDLIKIEQNPKFHPEGNVWNHTMQVVDNAAKYSKFSTNKRVFMWAAFLHDIGKATTTKIRKGKITAYDHDREGKKLAKDFLDTFIDDDQFINNVIKIVRWHMQPLFVQKNLPFAKLEHMIKDVSVSEVGLFSLCDRLGRGEISREKEMEETLVVMKFLTKCFEIVEAEEESKKIEKLMDYLSEKMYSLDRNKV